MFDTRHYRPLLSSPNRLHVNYLNGKLNGYLFSIKKRQFPVGCAIGTIANSSRGRRISAFSAVSCRKDVAAGRSSVGTEK